MFTSSPRANNSTGNPALVLTEEGQGNKQPLVIVFGAAGVLVTLCISVAALRKRRLLE